MPVELTEEQKKAAHIISDKVSTALFTDLMPFAVHAVMNRVKKTGAMPADLIEEIAFEHTNSMAVISALICMEKLILKTKNN